MNTTTRSWLHHALPIAAIFSFRMLGLFMLIPVFTLYATQLHEATPALIGVALGGYGLSQGLLQIPFGMLSDRFGRKPILTLGLILFAAGSLLGVYSHTIYDMIIARTLQGTGAIGSVLMALLADLTPDKARVKAMAVIGITIGLSFSAAMIISPAIASHFGLAGIFYLTTFLAALGLVFLHTLIPTPQKEPFQINRKANASRFFHVIKNPHLQRLNAGIFFLHMMLTSTFFVIPMILQQQIIAGHLTHLWHFYLPLMVTSFLAMLPFIILAEKKKLMRPVFLLSIFTLGLVQFVLAGTSQCWISLCIALFAYFTAFNILEASLPSLISRQADAAGKGTAMGIYSSSQFLGIFTGGALAGLLFQWAGSRGIFVLNGIIAILWLFIARKMQPNAYQLTLTFAYEVDIADESALSAALHAIQGVKEVRIAPTEKMIYLRVDKLSYQEGLAEAIIFNI